MANPMKAEPFPTSSKLPDAKIFNGQISMQRVWWMLALRSATAFGLLLLTAIIYKLAGSKSAIVDSSAWWLWFMTITNIVSLGFMFYFSRMEGGRVWDLYFFSRQTWKADLKWFLPVLVITLVIAMPPGLYLAQILWGHPNYPNNLLFQPLPAIAIYPLFLLLPITQAFAELPLYWGYVAPRLRAMGMNRWLVIGMVGMALSIQHMFFSFQLDWRYDIWLAFKFLPFALWTGFVVYRRPTTLPYFMFTHFLLDSFLPLLVLMVSNGMPLT
jgi:hypothetical protein